MFIQLFYDDNTLAFYYCLTAATRMFSFYYCGRATVVKATKSLLRLFSFSFLLLLVCLHSCRQKVKIDLYLIGGITMLLPTGDDLSINDFCEIFELLLF